MRSSSGLAPFPERPSIFEFRSPVKPELQLTRPGLNFEPKFTAKAPIERIQMKSALELPKRAVLSEQVHFDSSRSPDTHVLSASNGHSIVHSLIHKIRSHAAEHVPHLGQAHPAKKTKAAKKPTKKLARKPAKKLVRRKTAKSRKPVRARKKR
jgi:hypothetical protein